MRSIMERVSDERFFDTELAVLRNLLEILRKESKEGVSREKGFLYDCGSFSQAYRKYLQAKFGMRREKYASVMKVVEKNKGVYDVSV